MDNMEKMMQQILAQVNANAKANEEDLLARMEAIFDDNRKKAEEDRKAPKKKMAADKEDFLARMDAIHEKRMAMLEAQQKRTMACLVRRRLT
jgi:predicted Zn-dependent protease